MRSKNVKKRVCLSYSRKNDMFIGFNYEELRIEIEKTIVQNPQTEVIIGRYNSDGFPFDNEILFKNSNFNSYTSNRFFSYINQINFRPMIIWHYIVKKSLIKKKKIYFINVKNGEDEEFGVRLLCSMKLLSLSSKNYYWHKHRKRGLIIKIIN